MSTRHTTTPGPLDDPTFTVRPADLTVPAAWVGTPVGDVYGWWIRMRDDAGRATTRDWIVDLVEGWGADQRLEAIVGRVVDGLLSAKPALPVLVDDVCRELLVRVVATLLGVPTNDLGATARATTTLVRALADPSPDTSVRVGSAAALDTLRAALHGCPHRALGADRGVDGLEAEANLVALLVQAHDAGHGLLAGTLLAMADGRDPVSAVAHVLDEAPPIVLTRRWSATGDEVVVRLDGPPVTRPFGSGTHRCPAKALAPAVVAMAARRLVECGLPVGELAACAELAPSANARVHLFQGVGWRPRSG